MKLLLDENLDVKLRFRFGPTHEVMTVRQMDWLGKENGELLQLMQANGFDVLVTGDKNIQHQQNWQRYPLPIIVLVARPKIYAELVKLVPQVVALLAQLDLAGGVHVVQA
jgi:predicted nuclease of predicted toxin-antitoxin system